ncbi:AMP-binding protein [Streptomyces sp. NPDC051987]|uniref:AMP-binding protein n=1 Tax=Streptomyces sp. NPDC051987 TaxID=3155808 RepID=UPI003445FF98
MSHTATLHARFLHGLALHPTRIALRLEDGQEFTYEHLHELALRWAGALHTTGDEPPRAVGVLAGKTIAAYAGLLAALYAGAAAVPLHPEFPEARTRRMLDAAGVTTLLADRQGLTTLADPGIPVLAPLDQGPLPGRPLDAPLPVAPDGIACVLFTSGSTGRPKGVPVRHDSADHYFQVLENRYGFQPDDVFSQSFDLNFDCALFDLFCAWGAGASAHPVPAVAYRDLPGFAAARGLTVWFSTPSAITLVRRTGGLAPGSLPGLRWSFFAGEALRAADVEDWLAAAPGSTVENIYGPTELTVTITGHRWSPETSPELCVNGLVPIGRVHPGHDHVLLGENGTPDDTEGELCVTGPQLTAGYLDPRDDDGRFLERDGRRWYRTGDRVRRLPGDELVYLGRLDSQVQLHGWRVELAEVEHAVRGCVGVHDAVAVTRSDANGLHLVVYYTGVPTPARELARRLRDVLPKGMLPRHYRHLDAFPLNTNRKIDRARLRDLPDEH